MRVIITTGLLCAAIERGDYKATAAEMLDSRWARQAGKRADELAKQMETGQWQN